MKPTFLLCISVIILIAQSCSSSNPVSPTSFTLTAVAVTEATPTPTAPASTVEVTQTIAPAVTEAPTIAPTATETGPKEGDTKVENGYTFTYTVVKTADGKEPYTGWFRPMTLTPIPIWDYNIYAKDAAGNFVSGKAIGPIQVLVEEGVSGADTIQSLSHTKYQDLNSDQANNEYLDTVRPLFHMRFLGSPAKTGQDDQWQELVTNLQDGDPKTGSITFTVSGKKFSWGPGPNEGSVVYVMNWDHAAPTKDNGFVQWKDNTNIDNFRSAFWGIDAEGNILGAIASEKPLNQLSDKQIRMLPFFHTISILDGEDMTARGFSTRLDLELDKAGQVLPPYIEINKSNP